MESEDRNDKTIIIFLDVDGVLNNKWIGYHHHHHHHVGEEEENSSADGGSLQSQLLENLAELVHRLEIENGLEPRIVLSTTWRLQPKSVKSLLSSFGKIKVGRKTNNDDKTLEEYLDIRDDHEGNAACRSSWVTPDLGYGTTPEGRAAEIRSWLSNHCRINGLNGNNLLFLILDDLDLLYTETGKRNETINPQTFVCTVSYKGYRQVDGDVGLTKERVELALQRVQQQYAMRIKRRTGTGRWTQAEWTLLSAHPILQPHLQALRSDQCPSWITEIAEGYIQKTQKQLANGSIATQNRRWCCWWGGS